MDCYSAWWLNRPAIEWRLRDYRHSPLAACGGKLKPASSPTPWLLHRIMTLLIPFPFSLLPYVLIPGAARGASIFRPRTWAEIHETKSRVESCKQPSGVGTTP